MPCPLIIKNNYLSLFIFIIICVVIYYKLYFHNEIYIDKNVISYNTFNLITATTLINLKVIPFPDMERALKFNFSLEKA